MAVSVADKMSDTVKLNHTPSVPINKGRIYRQGRRKISCLVSERKMDFLTMPRLWKKLVPIILRNGQYVYQSTIMAESILEEEGSTVLLLIFQEKK